MNRDPSPLPAGTARRRPAARRPLQRWATAGLSAGLSLLALGLSGRAGADDLPGVPELGDPARAELIRVGTADDGLDVPRDLAFHPERPGELWTVNRADDSTVIYFDPGQPEQRIDKRIDAYAEHFMEEVSSIAFGDPGFFATCQESRNTYNDRHRPNDFMGPTLWPDDLEIYARVKQERMDWSLARLDGFLRGELCGSSPAGEEAIEQDDRCSLGSHLDMNHQSPNCMGIEHDRGNAYWTFDGHSGHIVYYDFAADHGPGCDDHSDGIVRRYTEATATRLPDVPGHMALDRQTGWLYYADTGAGVVRRLDTAPGDRARNLGRTNEPLAEFSQWTGATVEVFANDLQEPTGLALGDGLLFVGDHGTGRIHAYHLDSGTELARLDTGAEGLMGLERGPDGRLWYVDAAANELRYVEPHGETPPLPTATPAPSATAEASATPRPTATDEPTPTPEPIRSFLPWLRR